MKQIFHPGKCDYCNNIAIVSFEKHFTYSSRGHIKNSKVIHRSCEEHENCINWKGILEIYKPQLVYNIT